MIVLVDVQMDVQGVVVDPAVELASVVVVVFAVAFEAEVLGMLYSHPVGIDLGVKVA